MPNSTDVRPGVRIAYEDDWFGPPWQEGDPIMLVHGVAESSIAWRQWVPHLSASLRVIRPDLPGFGNSPVPTDYQWTPAEMAADLVRVADALGIERFHLVGAKYGGSTALQLAQDFPDRVRTLAVVGSPAKGRHTGGKADLAAVPERNRAVGVRAGAQESQLSRRGGDAPAEQLVWWTEGLMGKADARAAIGCAEAVARMNVEERCGEITAPTLVITTADSPLQPIATVKAYQERIPNARLLVLPGDCYHIAAVRPAECARHVLEFIRSVG